MEMADLG